MSLSFDTSAWPQIVFPPSAKTRCRKIIAESAKRFGVTVAALSGDGRCANLAACRQEAAALCARHTTLSMAGIGRLMSKDHTTIIWAIRRYNTIHGTDIRGTGIVTEKRKAVVLAAAHRTKARRQAERARRTELLVAQDRLSCSPEAVANALARSRDRERAP